MNDKKARKLGFSSLKQMQELAKGSTLVAFHVRSFLEKKELGVYATVHNREHNRHIRKALNMSNRQFKKGIRTLNNSV